ncbi:MAG: glycoside hydrolase family 13 protein [Chloroflexi bacterium]|nr:glycoside hydrolase family 13 protein [Chloroflexota bacterium]
MSVPEWIQDAVFYQIFPDRFVNGDPQNDPPNVQPWGSLPTSKGFLGGDLQGILQKLDYLLDLGINAIYLNPIFLSPSNHRYNIIDYYRIDPKLGDMEVFRRLLEEFHSHNIRVILDGVFNHCGRGFFAFNDLLENQDQSPYTDWYTVNHYPIDAYSPGEADDYLGWWKLKSLPKFNTNNPLARKYLLGVARYWVEQGIDGWRLDVPNEIDDDSFWEEFRHVVRSINPDAYLVGEIWEALPRWIGDAHFDGLMHYPLREALLRLLKQKITISQFAYRIDQLLAIYPIENTLSMYVTLGTHDTERIITLCGGDLAKTRLAFTFLLAYPGAPGIYYGDEIGLEGGKDPDNRRAFPWDPGRWKPGLREWVQKLIDLRIRHAALRRGSYKGLLVDNETGGYAFARVYGEEMVIAVLNPTPEGRSLKLPLAALNLEEGRRLQNLTGPGEFAVAEATVSLHLDPWSGLWLSPDP